MQAMPEPFCMVDMDDEFVILNLSILKFKLGIVKMFLLILYCNCMDFRINK